jgi:hypothetical protein
MSRAERSRRILSVHRASSTRVVCPHGRGHRNTPSPDAAPSTEDGGARRAPGRGCAQLRRRARPSRSPPAPRPAPRPAGPPPAEVHGPAFPRASGAQGHRAQGLSRRRPMGSWAAPSLPPTRLRTTGRKKRFLSSFFEFLFLFSGTLA